MLSKTKHFFIENHTQPAIAGIFLFSTLPPCRALVRFAHSLRGFAPWLLSKEVLAFSVVSLSVSW